MLHLHRTCAFSLFSQGKDSPEDINESMTTNENDGDNR